MSIRKFNSVFLARQRIKVSLPYFGRNILDLGCGPAHVLSVLQSSQKYTGVEIRSNIFSNLIKKYPNYKFFQFDLDKDILEFSCQFDTILLLAVIEHLKHPEFLLQQIPYILENNGILIVTTPTPFGNHVHHIGSKFSLLSSEAADEHYSTYNFAHFKALIEANGLKIVNYRKFLLGGNQLFVCKTQ